MPDQRPEHAWEVRFVKNMLRLRELQGLTQTDLARGLKERGLPFHQQTIQRIENHERPVRLNEAYLIAEHLDVDLLDMTERIISSDQEVRLAMRNLVSKAEAIAVETYEHYSDWLDSIIIFGNDLRDALETTYNSDDDRDFNFLVLPTWLQRSLAFSVKIVETGKLLQNTVAVVVSSFGKNGGEEVKEGELEWAFVDSEIISTLETWISQYDCEELRTMAQATALVLYRQVQDDLTDKKHD
jgi:transcriptional regulator with XRE-family HTH domain